MKYKNALMKICRLSVVTEEQIHSIFRREEITVRVSKKHIGMPGFEIITNEGIYFVTERKTNFYNNRHRRTTELQQIMLDLAIPVPLYIGEGPLVKGIFEIVDSDTPKKNSDIWLHDNFSIEIALTYFYRHFSESNSLKGYKNIIFESIEAFYMGMDHIAIMSLLPVFEAGLRNIQTSVLGMDSQNVSTEKFEKGLEELVLKCGRRKVESYIGYPGKGYNKQVEIDFLTHISPQADVVNAFRIFFSEALYKSSTNEPGSFNRHLIVHMLKNDFNNPANFIRIFLALTQITFIESLENQAIPFFWPGYEDDELVKTTSVYIRAISKQFGSPRRKLLDQLEINQYYRW